MCIAHVVYVYWHKIWLSFVFYTQCSYLLQELRKLVRKVHSAQEMKTTTNEEEEKKIEILEIKAKKALTRFLRSLSKNIANEHS